MRRLELESQKEVHVLSASAEAISSSPIPSLGKAFDISEHIVLVPTFRQTEVDSYFNAFEHIASALQWPSEVWPLLLQCKINGKAQEAVATLPLEDSLRYESVKAAILRAYELVPEVYRQTFRNHKRAPTQNYVEFAREKGECLSISQSTMKRHYDRSAVPRHFQVGDKVLALLPIPGSSLSARFSGPYEVCDRLSDTTTSLALPKEGVKLACVTLTC